MQNCVGFINIGACVASGADESRGASLFRIGQDPAGSTCRTLRYTQQVLQTAFNT